MRENRRPIAVRIANPPGEAGGGIDAGFGQLGPQRNRVPPARERHQADHLLALRFRLEYAGERQAEQRMAGVQVAERELVADVGPADLTLERDAQAFVGEVPQLRRRDQRGGVDQGDKAQPQRATARNLLNVLRRPGQQARPDNLSKIRRPTNVNARGSCLVSIPRPPH